MRSQLVYDILFFLLLTAKRPIEQFADLQITRVKQQLCSLTLLSMLQHKGCSFKSPTYELRTYNLCVVVLFALVCLSSLYSTLYTIR